MSHRHSPTSQAAAPGAGHGAAGGAGPARPNLLVIMSDQHSPRVLGCAGDGVVRTPHLDRLAAGGVRFASAYCGSPLCVPSRATFLTGQQCSAIRVWSNQCALASEVPTFAHALGAAGYETVLCGRMHFRGPDQRHGFGERLVGDVSPPLGGRRSTVLDGLPPGGNRQTYVATAISGPGRTGYQAYDAAVTEGAVRWLRQRAARGSGRPFCLVVGLLLPHNPYIAPRDLYEAYLARVEVPETPTGYLETLHPAALAWRRATGLDAVTPDQARSARAAYFGLVTMLDGEVGRILDALEETGLTQETAVFYTSDHGDMAGDLGLWWKSTCYEGSVGVPLLAAWPDRFPAGTVVGEPVSLTDLAPTLIDLAGAPPLPHASGRVLTRLLGGAGAPGAGAGWSPGVYAENAPAGGCPPARMVRRGPWKLVHHHGFETPQLFNLAEDPYEVDDRAGDPRCRPVREALHGLATAGWDGAVVEAAVRRRQADTRLLGAWARTVQPPEPDHWQPPPGCNVFPEPDRTRATVDSVSA